MAKEEQISSTQLHQFYEFLAIAGSCKEPAKGQIALREKLFSHLWSDLWPIEIALDLGCGRGENLQLLGSRTKMTLGVDISINVMKSIPRDGTFLVLADVRRLPFCEGRVQAVIATEIIEHIPNQKSFLREVYRVLANRGLLVLSFPNPNRLARLVSSKLYQENRGPPRPLSYDGREERRHLELRMNIREHLHEPTISEVSRMMLEVGFGPTTPAPAAFSFPTPRILAKTPLLAKMWHRVSAVQTRLPLVRKISWNIVILTRKIEAN